MIPPAEITAMQAVVAGSFDQTLSLYRKTVITDGYGHSVETWPGTPTLMLPCNTRKPTTLELTVFADIIAGKRAMMLRYAPQSDVREGDRIVYLGVNWRIQQVAPAESYTFSDEVLMVTIT